MEGGLICISYQLLNLREDVALEIEIKLWLLRADHLREILKAHLVPILELSIVISPLLNGIIR